MNWIMKTGIKTTAWRCAGYCGHSDGRITQSELFIAILFSPFESFALGIKMDKLSFVGFKSRVVRLYCNHSIITNRSQTFHRSQPWITIYIACNNSWNKNRQMWISVTVLTIACKPPTVCTHALLGSCSLFPHLPTHAFTQTSLLPTLVAWWCVCLMGRKWEDYCLVFPVKLKRPTVKVF